MSDADILPATGSPVHPAPARHRANLWMLLATLGVAPAVWALHIMFNFALASQTCYPEPMPQQAGGTHWAVVFVLLLISDLVTIAVGLGLGLVAMRAWRDVREERAGHEHTLIEVGEGRTRFLAFAGMLTSFTFAVAVVFDLLGLVVVHSCGT